MRVYILWKKTWQYVKKLHMHLLFKQVMPCLEVWPEDTPSQIKNNLSTKYLL